MNRLDNDRSIWIDRIAALRLAAEAHSDYAVQRVEHHFSMALEDMHRSRLFSRQSQTSAASLRHLFEAARHLILELGLPFSVTLQHVIEGQQRCRGTALAILP